MAIGKAKWACFCCSTIIALAAGGAEAKFHALAVGAYPPGSRVSISTRELNDYLRSEIPAVVGPGVRNARVETDTGNIVRGFADIDFLTVRQAQGQKPGWLMSQLLSGERPVEVTARVTSGNGSARVDVLQASVSGITVEGRTLDFLIANFVRPTFPDVKVGQDFALDYNIDRLEIRPAVITIVLRGRGTGAPIPR